MYEIWVKSEKNTLTHLLLRKVLFLSAGDENSQVCAQELADWNFCYLILGVSHQLNTYSVKHFFVEKHLGTVSLGSIFWVRASLCVELVLYNGLRHLLIQADRWNRSEKPRLQHVTILFPGIDRYAARGTEQGESIPFHINKILLFLTNQKFL